MPAIRSAILSTSVEAIGSTANRAVILNNLGIVHSQSDRPGEALRRFREAERQALDLDEGPSLSFIHGNVAVLLSKTGDFEGMERSLCAADEVASGARSAVRSGGEEARLPFLGPRADSVAGWPWFVLKPRHSLDRRSRPYFAF